MGQSLVINNLHIVFATKHRKPMIFPPHEEALHAYLGGICKKLECPPIIIGGYTNHIHILCSLSKKIPLMKLVEELKSHSSAWMKSQNNELKSFFWQDGYGAFSVNPTHMDALIRYIRNQHAHHNKKEFQEEYRETLIKHNVSYDERYVWD